MTEQEWLINTDTNGMLASLRGKASDRKLRLFACACCRRVWHFLTEGCSRSAVEVAEQVSDGETSPGEMARTRLEIWVLLGSPAEKPSSWISAFRAAGRVGERVAAEAALYAAREAASALAEQAEETATERPGAVASEADAWYFAMLKQERTQQYRLLLDIVGDPLRPAFSPTWLTWRNGLVVRLAQAAYEERILPRGTLDNARLAVLADALEEAGCDNADILAHCRNGGEHVRGCWVVDLLLNKS